MPRRRPPAALPRLLLAAMVLAGILVQPVLGAAHDLDQIRHLLEGGVPHGDEGDHDHGDGDGDGDGDGVHRVLHGFDCALHPAALPAQSRPWPAAPAAAMPGEGAPAGLPSAIVAGELRPPIPA